MTLQLEVLTNQLLGNLSAQAKVLTNPDSEEFQQLIVRWSDIDRKVPGAIVVAGVEEDVVKTVNNILLSHSDAINDCYLTKKKKFTRSKQPLRIMYLLYPVLAEGTAYGRQSVKKGLSWTFVN